ncbi:ATP-binding protein, partial [Myxococcota bacterium]|nr:ATP-binding protein [Myxococcota bacterium]
TVDVERAPIVVWGYETRLAQVLGNLLHNARKFTPSGGRVAIHARVDGDAAIVEVVDTGAGITPELRARLFEPFTQAQQTIARSEGGLGLGLALVQGLARLHGGDVDVASEGAGRGATFVVRLPLLRG